MADPRPVPNLLESDQTPRERAHANVDGRFADVDAGLPARVKSSADAAPVYLPYLAWERSVDVYDPAWPVDVRRDVIAAAPEVHRVKGTRHAVAVALGALGIDAEVTEWFEATPRAEPYTFRVTAFARARLYDGPLLDARLVRAAFNVVMATKPLSRAFDITVSAAMPSSLALTPVAVGRVAVRKAMQPDNSAALSAGAGLAPVAVGRVRVRASMIVSPAP